MAAPKKAKPSIITEDLTVVDSGISLTDLLEDATDDLDTLKRIDLPSSFPAWLGDDSLDDDILSVTKEVVADVVSKVKVTDTIVGVDLAKVDIEAMIKDVGDVPEWITVVAYGKNGTGKTTFGASGDRTLVIEVEKDGTFSVRERGSKAKKYPVKTWKDFENIYWYLLKNPGKYDIVCIDTLTRLLELCVRDIVLGEKAKDSELMDKDVIRVTLAQRGDVGQRMIFWLNAFANLPLHKVWLCQEASGGDTEDVKDIEYYPDLQRKVRIYVCSDATIIGRMIKRFKEEVTETGVKQGVQYAFLVKPSEQYLSKDRTNSLGAGMVNPKIDKLISAVYAHK